MRDPSAWAAIYCPYPKLPAASTWRLLCAQKIPSISTKLHHKPVTGQVITKELKKPQPTFWYQGVCVMWVADSTHQTSKVTIQI